MKAHSSVSTSAADTTHRERTAASWAGASTFAKAAVDKSAPAISFVALGTVLLLTAATWSPAAQDSQSPADVMDRAVSDFFAARIPESVAGFDRLAKMVPREAPELWQRGIALYYANRYADSPRQRGSPRREPGEGGG